MTTTIKEKVEALFPEKIIILACNDCEGCFAHMTCEVVLAAIQSNNTLQECKALVPEILKLVEKEKIVSNIALMTLLVENGTKGDLERLIKEFTNKLTLLSDFNQE